MRHCFSLSAPPMIDATPRRRHMPLPIAAFAFDYYAADSMRRHAADTLMPLPPLLITPPC
jgi:hypothetical protein